MNWRVARFAALGCGTLSLIAFVALAISGYRLVHSAVPGPAVAALHATQDPHLTVTLLSRAQLQAVMPAAPAGWHLVAENFHEAYCLDDCPTLTRTYDVPGGSKKSCAALVAIRSGYLLDGFAQGGASYPQTQFPATVRECLAAMSKPTWLGFGTEFVKDTSPTSRLQFSISVRSAGDRLTIVTS